MEGVNEISAPKPTEPADHSGGRRIAPFGDCLFIWWYFYWVRYCRKGRVETWLHLMSLGLLLPWFSELHRGYVLHRYIFCRKEVLQEFWPWEEEKEQVEWCQCIQQFSDHRPGGSIRFLIWWQCGLGAATKGASSAPEKWFITTIPSRRRIHRRLGLAISFKVATFVTSWAVYRRVSVAYEKGLCMGLSFHDPGADSIHHS